MAGRGRVVSVFIVLILFLSAVPVTAQGAPPDEIGRYVRAGMSGTLTADDSTPSGNGLIVEAPWMSSRVKVDKAWLDGELGDWGTQVPFDMDEQGRAVFEGDDDVRFDVFEPDEVPAFTFGSSNSIRLENRPMWISVEALNESRYRIEMDDGDTTGQEIYLSKDWLRSLGIHRPNVTHENGSYLDATPTEDGLGFIVDVQHFSFVVVGPSFVAVKGQIGSLISSFDGTVWWDNETKTLKLDVNNQLTSYKVWVEKDFLDVHIPHYALRTYSWTPATWQSMDFLVVTLTTAQTPTTLWFEPFVPSTTPKFTRGSPSNIQIWAPNETARLDVPPVFISLTTDTPPSIQLGSAGVYRFEVNKTLTSAWGIDRPMFNASDGRNHFFESYDGLSWVVQAFSDATLNITENVGEPYLQESRAQSVRLWFNNTSLEFEVKKFAYTPWLLNPGENVTLYLDNVDWGTDHFGYGNLSAINLTSGGETVATVYPVNISGNASVPMGYSAMVPEWIIDEALGIVFSYGVGQPDSQVFLGPVASTLTSLTGVFESGQDCHAGAAYFWRSAFPYENTAYHGDGTTDVVDQTVQGWAEEFSFTSTCDGEAIGSVTYDFVGSVGGRTLWTQGETETQAMLVSIMSDDYYDSNPHGMSAYARLNNPTVHVATPCQAVGINCEWVIATVGGWAGHLEPDDSANVQLSWILKASFAALNGVVKKNPWVFVTTTVIKAVVNYIDFGRPLEDVPTTNSRQGAAGQGAILTDLWSAFGVNRGGGFEVQWDVLEHTGDVDYIAKIETRVHVSLWFDCNAVCTPSGQEYTIHSVYQDDTTLMSRAIQ